MDHLLLGKELNIQNLMTVRIAEKVGLEKILSLSKTLDIYDENSELLSVSLGLLRLLY